jgi:hypothetical protein
MTMEGFKHRYIKTTLKTLFKWNHLQKKWDRVGILTVILADS